MAISVYNNFIEYRATALGKRRIIQGIIILLIGIGFAVVSSIIFFAPLIELYNKASNNNTTIFPSFFALMILPGLVSLMMILMGVYFSRKKFIIKIDKNSIELFNGKKVEVVDVYKIVKLNFLNLFFGGPCSAVYCHLKGKEKRLFQVSPGDSSDDDLKKVLNFFKDKGFQVDYNEYGYWYYIREFLR